jgi:hypothetical protein
MKSFPRKLINLVIIGFLAFPLILQAGDKRQYEVTVTNLTRAQVITPVLVASHKRGVNLFTLGYPASDELVAIAESGNIQPLSDAWLESGKAYATATNGALLQPGESTTISVAAKDHFDHISVAAMLVPTNDGFIALNGIRAPKGKRVVNVISPAYDAGSEANDEQCVNIPGPYCGGSGLSPNDDGEGYVHIHGGIHGVADLMPATFDWRNPVAKISIKQIR